ncbi:MAG: hypothetical protein HYR49_05805 [Gammaproteobacteria bacterium]|nr:hypothetical protein [Gammaproteobacteria bacterium]
MKATIEVPDDLYRRVKAKSALEGRPVRQVAVDLFRFYVEETAAMAAAPKSGRESSGVPQGVQEQPPPPWFGLARDYARSVKDHSLEEIRTSIARGRAKETAEAKRSPHRKPKR